MSIIVTMKKLILLVTILLLATLSGWLLKDRLLYHYNVWRMAHTVEEKEISGYNEKIQALQGKAGNSCFVNTYNDTTKPNRVRRAAAMALIKSDVTLAETLFKQHLDSTNPEVSGMAIRNLGAIKSKKYINQIITDMECFNIPKLWIQNDLFETEGIFIKPGLLRIKIPSVLVLDSSVIFSLANQISFNDSLFNINGSSFRIKVVKIPSEFSRAWDVFASESAGVSGTVGSVGAGASAAAAKLSVKGSAGAGLTITKDQDSKITLDRRIEASIGVGLEVPSLNAVGAKATVGTGTIVVKALLGQEFSFSDISLSEDTKKMAQAGFLLETFAIAGVGFTVTITVKVDPVQVAVAGVTV